MSVHGRRILGMLLAVVAIIAIALAIAMTMPKRWWSTDYAEVRARWAQPPSTFVGVDGVDLHVRDEGQGPVVVMLHGSILNLHEWDLVAERLVGKFRVVRFDWPPYGVSGPDPSGIYTTARAADLMAGLIERLELGKFFLVATSNGVNIALDYNARYPGRVRAMALSVLPLERPSQTRKVDWRIRKLMWFHAAFAPDNHSKYWYRLILEDTTPADFVPPDDLVQMMYDMNNLPGASQHQRDFIASNVRLFQSSDVGALAGKVDVPVLIQWCDQDTVISQSAERTVSRFTRAPVTLVRYPQFGHFPMWEDPDLFTRDLAVFLSQQDAQ
ncbi:MAG: alpha/beta hydrolase [Steroidobacteraceae bacterium]